MTTKLILLHGAAIERKYAHRASRVHTALERLVRADRGRRLHTRVIAIDDARAMSALGARPARDVLDAHAVKKAVDAVCNKLQAHYVLLLDGPDVLPHQTLTRGLPVDEDPSVPSDMPYACDTPPSDDARDFTNPTRVVGRLPGITGDGDPTALVRALATAATWSARSRRSYDECFALCASDMLGSTELSMDHVFGSHGAVQRVPPEGPRWPKSLLARRSHFLNCHGVLDWSEFEGESPRDFLIALSSRYAGPRLARGTVAVVEACYGAQLYDPKQAQSFQPMVNSYLRHGAYAYLGSSTASYGDFEKNARADYLCQYFMRHVLRGASTGRALLEARHEYLQDHSRLTPLSVKTLVQFALFGDPSIHPVHREHDAAKPADASVVGDVHAHQAMGRHERRLRLRARGEALHAAATIYHAVPHATPAAIGRKLHALVRSAGAATPRVHSHRATPRPVAAKHRRELGARADAVHLASGLTQRSTDKRPRRIFVVAHEERGRLVSFECLHSKGAPDRSSLAHLRSEPVVKTSGRSSASSSARRRPA